jgi:hypothetical protein
MLEVIGMILYYLLCALAGYMLGVSLGQWFSAWLTEGARYVAQGK